MARKSNNLKAEAKDGVLSLTMYDPIDDWWGISAKSVRKEIDNAGELSRIEVHLNSPGGNAMDGVAIYNTLRETGKPVSVFVDGLAASAASVIAMAGDDITMREGSMLMIHDASLVTIGNEEDHRKSAQILDAVSENMARLYAKKTGKDAEEIRDWMREEKWMDAAEAVSLGFATAMDEEEADEYKATANAPRFVAAWHNAPAEIAARYPQFCSPASAGQAPVEASIHNPKEGEMTQPTVPDPTPANTPEPPTAPAPQAKVVGLTAELKDKAKLLMSACKLTPDQRTAIWESHNDFEAIENAIIEAANKATKDDTNTPVLPPVTGGNPQALNAVPALSDALLMAGGLIHPDGKMVKPGAKKDPVPLHADAAKFKKLGLLGTVRFLAEAIGVPSYLDGHDLVKAYGERTNFRAQAGGLNTTSSFPVLLENALNKLVLYTFENAPRTWDRVAQVLPANDYRVHNLHKTGQFESLAPVNEAGEVETFRQPDSVKELLTPLQWASNFGVTDVLIVNNDTPYVIGSLTGMAEAAMLTVEKEVYYLLMSNPTMLEDSEQMFSVAHGNTGTDLQGPSVASLDEIFGKMMTQKGLNGEPLLGNEPVQLIVPAGLRGRTMELLNSQYVPGGTNNTDNIYRGALEPIVAPYLTNGVTVRRQNGVTLSVAAAPTKWYAQSRFKAIAIGFVNGPVPQIASQNHIEVLGTTLRVNLNFGVGQAEWRGAFQWTNADPDSE